MSYNKLVLIVLVLITFFSFPFSVFAESDFSLSFDVRFSFDEQGNAHVTKHITLTNLHTDTYPSIYLVDVPEDASEVTSVDNKGTLETKTITEGGRKMVRISLPEQNIGEAEKTTITLSFNTRALAKNTENTWQVVIPPFSADESIVSYTTRVTVPDVWGDLLYKSPASESKHMWTMNEHKEENIILTYGKLPTNAVSQNQTSANMQNIFIGLAIGVFLAITLFLLSRLRIIRI